MSEEKKKYSFMEKLNMTSAHKMKVGEIYHIISVSDPYEYTNKTSGEIRTGVTVTTDIGDYYLPDTVVKSMIESGFEESRKFLLDNPYIRCRSFRSKFGTNGKSIEKATQEQYENTARLK